MGDWPDLPDDDIAPSSLIQKVSSQKSKQPFRPATSGPPERNRSNDDHRDMKDRPVRKDDDFRPIHKRPDNNNRKSSQSYDSQRNSRDYDRRDSDRYDSVKPYREQPKSYDNRYYEKWRDSSNERRSGSSDRYDRSETRDDNPSTRSSETRDDKFPSHYSKEPLKRSQSDDYPSQSRTSSSEFPSPAKKYMGDSATNDLISSSSKLESSLSSSRGSKPTSSTAQSIASKSASNGPKDADDVSKSHAAARGVDNASARMTSTRPDLHIPSATQSSALGTTLLSGVPNDVKAFVTSRGVNNALAWLTSAINDDGKPLSSSSSSSSSFASPTKPIRTADTADDSHHEKSMSESMNRGQRSRSPITSSKLERPTSRSPNLNARCGVCGKGESEDMFMQSCLNKDCSIYCHDNCRGDSGRFTDLGDWECAECLGKDCITACALCFNNESSLYRTKFSPLSKAWIHPLCLRASKCFITSSKRSPSKCVICESSSFVVVKCDHPTCNSHIHPSCCFHNPDKYSVESDIPNRISINLDPALPYDNEWLYDRGLEYKVRFYCEVHNTTIKEATPEKVIKSSYKPKTTKESIDLASSKTKSKTTPKLPTVMKMVTYEVAYILGSVAQYICKLNLVNTIDYRHANTMIENIASAFSGVGAYHWLKVLPNYKVDIFFKDVSCHRKLVFGMTRHKELNPMMDKMYSNERNAVLGFLAWPGVDDPQHRIEHVDLCYFTSKENALTLISNTTNLDASLAKDISNSSYKYFMIAFLEPENPFEADAITTKQRENKDRVANVDSNRDSRQSHQHHQSKQSSSSSSHEDRPVKYPRHKFVASNSAGLWSNDEKIDIESTNKSYLQKSKKDISANLPKPVSVQKIRTKAKYIDSDDDDDKDTEIFANQMVNLGKKLINPTVTNSTLSEESLKQHDQSLSSKDDTPSPLTDDDVDVPPSVNSQPKQRHPSIVDDDGNVMMLEDNDNPLPIYPNSSDSYHSSLASVEDSSSLIVETALPPSISSATHPSISTSSVDHADTSTSSHQHLLEAASNDDPLMSSTHEVQAIDSNNVHASMSSSNLQGFTAHDGGVNRDNDRAMMDEDANVSPQAASNPSKRPHPENDIEASQPMKRATVDADSTSNKLIAVENDGTLSQQHNETMDCVEETHGEDASIDMDHSNDISPSCKSEQEAFYVDTQTSDLASQSDTEAEDGDSMSVDSEDEIISISDEDAGESVDHQSAHINQHQADYSSLLDSFANRKKRINSKTDCTKISRDNRASIDPDDSDSEVASIFDGSTHTSDNPVQPVIKQEFVPIGHSKYSIHSNNPVNQNLPSGSQNTIDIDFDSDSKPTTISLPAAKNTPEIIEILDDDDEQDGIYFNI